MSDEFFETTLKFSLSTIALMLALFLVFFIPACTYQSYEDSVACKRSTGLYDCSRKAQEHTENLNVNTNKATEK